MTYDFVEYGISHRNYFQIPIRTMHGKDCVHDVRKSHRTVPKNLPKRWLREDHYEMALYRTDPYHTMPYMMHVVYRTEINTNTLFSQDFLRKSYHY